MLSLRQWEPSSYELGDHTITFEVKRLGFLESKPWLVHANRMRFDVLLAQGRIIEAMQHEERKALRGFLKGAAADAGIAWPTVEDARQGWRERHAEAVAKAPDNADLAALTDEGEPDEDVVFMEVNARFKAAGLDVPEMGLEATAALVAAQEPHLAAAAAKMAEFSESLDDPWIAKTFNDYVRNVDGVEIDGKPATTGDALLSVADDTLVMYVMRRVKELCSLSAQAKKTSSLPRTSAPEARTPDGGPTAPPAASADGPTPATVTETLPEQPSSSVSETGPVLVSP